VAISELVEDARRRGLATQDASADFIYDAVIGALVHRYIIRQLPPDEEFLDSLTALTNFLYQGCQS